jgi:hypothetical protein
MHNLFPNKVKLEPISHRYYHENGDEYMSWSKFSKNLSQQFEDKYAYKIATPEKRAEWAVKRDDAANHGTRIHNALEYYDETGLIKAEDAEFTELIKSVASEYGAYNKVHNEVCLYNETYKIAGTTDKICVVSNRKDSAVDLADYKTNGMGIDYFSKYGDKLYPPLDHLQDCNFVKYSLQLSLYAYFFEELTGRKVRRLYIHFIPPQNPMSHYKIPVMYMKNDIKLILDKYAVKNPQSNNQSQEVLEF